MISADHIITNSKKRYNLIDRAEKFNLYSGDNKILDIMSYNSFILGHGNERIINAMFEQMKKVSRAQMSFGNITESTIKASNFICDSGGWAGVSFTTSGTSAVEAAINLCDSYWNALNQQKPYIISFTPTWHGTSFLTKSIGFSESLPYKKRIERSLVVETPIWKNIEDRIEEEKKSLDKLFQIIKQNQNQIGCIIFDPSPVFNGNLPFSSYWWKEIRRLCDEFNILMITDDVASGWGKYGCWHTHEKNGGGVKANISCLGKGLSAGYSSISSVVVDQKVFDIVQGRTIYGHTLNPDLAGIAAINETVDIIKEQNLFENIDNFPIKLEDVKNNCESIEEVTVRGCFASINFKENYDIENLKSYGLSYRNLADNTLLKFCIPLNADDDFFDQLTSVCLSLKLK